MSLSKVLTVVAVAASLALAVGCKKERRAKKKLPPADDWQASPMTSPNSAQPQAGSMGTNPHAGMGAAGGDPHAGMNMGAGGDPHAGMNMGAGGGDPHAGMNMGGGGGDPHAGMNMGAGGGDPHAGMNMGANPHAAADDPMARIQPPDPNRAIDKSKFLKGQIVTTAATKDLVAAGAKIFVSVKPVNPATREPVGDVVAVARIDVTTMPVSFHLDGSNAMSAGTSFSGDVLITAWVDSDGEARTRSPGDIEGSLLAKIPADKLELKLDSVLR